MYLEQSTIEISLQIIYYRKIIIKKDTVYLGKVFEIVGSH